MPYTTPPSAEMLLARTARGDEAAFAALYDRLSPVIFGVVRRVLRDPAQSEEVMQEVLLEVATGLSNTEIAEKLVVSEATVKTHVGSILARLGLRSVEVVDVAGVQVTRSFDWIQFATPALRQVVESVVLTIPGAALIGAGLYRVLLIALR